MKIAVDARSLLDEAPGGVPTYTRGVIQALQDAGADLVLFQNNWRTTRIPNKLLNLSLSLFGRPHLDKLVGGADTFFLPNLKHAAFSSKVKVALTVHDLSFLINPSWFSPRSRLSHRMIHPERLIRRADAIIAVSETTKRDIVEMLGVAAEKIIVNPPIVSTNPLYPPYAKGDNDRNDTPLKIRGVRGVMGDYLLFLGSVSTRKNVLGLIRAYELLKPDLDLVIAGPDGWGSREVDRAIRHSPLRARIRRTGAVDEQTKWQLMAGARAFVFPSFYEGFGIPPLEAMAAGVPVVASNRGSLPEVLSSAALLPNPYDANELATAISALISDEKLRKTLIDGGHERVRHFSVIMSQCGLALTRVLSSDRAA